MTKEALELAQKVSIQIWSTYDDTYKYASGKIALCEAEGTDDPESIWFYWNQFDPNNQDKFFELVNQAPPGDGKDVLLDWLLNGVEEAFKKYCHLCGEYNVDIETHRCPDCGEVVR